MLDYAILVATRNRLSALQVSLPLFVAQSRPPARILLVDRSDDHAAVAAWIAEFAGRTAIPVALLHGEAANLPAQRNQGLAHIAEPVTMLPDDDSLWFPDTAERIMAVYEEDTEGRIGGVSGIGVSTSPLGSGDTPENARRFVRQPRVGSPGTELEFAL